MSVEACRINLALVRSASRTAILAQSFFAGMHEKISIGGVPYTETALTESFKRICEWRRNISSARVERGGLGPA